MLRVKSKGFIASPEVLAQALAFGIGANQLQDMLVKSARITHGKGNRRYEDFVFNVEGNRVLSVHELNPVKKELLDAAPDPNHYRCSFCKDTKRVQVFNECPRCYGEGCKKCDQGLVPSSIPCSVCASEKVQHHRAYYQR